jgi:hypothetical protein
MGRMDGKVAFLTGAATGEGRSHAVRLRREGMPIPWAPAEDISTATCSSPHEARYITGVALQVDAGSCLK